VTILLSFGQGVDMPQARRVSVDNVAAALQARDPGVETWWSGHVWTGDRRNNRSWESTSVIVIDVDHYASGGDRKRKHSAPPDARRAALQEAWLDDCPGSLWHHTPRGARVAYVLTRAIVSERELGEALRGATALVTRALRASGVQASLDSHGQPHEGYAVDEVARDKARFVFMPNAIVGGEPRVGLIYVPETEATFTPEALCEAAPGGFSPQLGPVTADDQLAEEHEEIREALAKLDAEGENDGSLALMRCARRAVSLGVQSSEAFLEVVAKWNAKRRSPWEPSELIRRFEDALARWVEEGRAQVPLGRYSRVSLRRVLTEDRELKGRFAYDEIDQTVLVDGHALDDDNITDLEVMICDRYAWRELPRQKLEDDVRAIAGLVRVNRVLDYLEALTWDGTERVSLMAERCNVVENQREIGSVYWRKFMIGAVRRAVRPGCKLDHMLVLVGDESYFKSTLIEVLAGSENFSDTHLDLDKGVDAYQQIASTWIYEWSELEAVTHKSELSRIKGFMSSKTDFYRAPYDRRPMKHPRRGCFYGSSNSHDLLLDKDSSRRFWVLDLAAPIDLEWFTEHRDQLWAEAIQLERTGEKHWLPPAQEKVRAETNLRYQPDDPFVDAVLRAVDHFRERPDFVGHILVADLYVHLGLDLTRTSASLKSAISGTLHRAGFERRRSHAYGPGKPSVYALKDSPIPYSLKQ
jgi:hypothetical protein